MIGSVYYNSNTRGELVGVDNATCVEIAIESILVGCSGVVRNLDSTRLSRSVPIDIEIRGLVEAMQHRPRCRLSEVVMTISKAAGSQRELLKLASDHYMAAEQTERTESPISLHPER